MDSHGGYEINEIRGAFFVYFVLRSSLRGVCELLGDGLEGETTKEKPG